LRQPLTERYRERLAGVLSCYDRIIVAGTLPGACYAKGMTGMPRRYGARLIEMRSAGSFLCAPPSGCCNSITGGIDLRLGRGSLSAGFAEADLL
jgi:hypothetical protein